MDKAKKDVGQKFRRIKHNLVNSSKKEEDEDLRPIQSLEHRNNKIIHVIHNYKKNVSNTIKTGLKEENVDKRRKKLDEAILVSDLKEGAAELEALQSTCLHKVMSKMASTIQFILEEKVKHDMMVEKRVLDDLSQYQEIDKNLAKSREKLSNAYTDLDIARRSLEKSDNPQHHHLQENVDAAHQKLESQKDSTITDIYSLAAKEQEVCKIFASLMEEQLEFHRLAMRTIEMALPEIRRDIDNARPRPVFGVDLTEHLRHTQTRIAVVLERCCEILRRNGMTEKGVFRVSGNNTKIRRMKAAFDAGQIDNDMRAYHLDPHSVCSVLKSYLRELPDPLLTHRLHNEWMNAARLDGEERLKAIESCIVQLPAAHRDNLTYLINFLAELLMYQDQTAMNAGNLAIVFGPNLLSGDIEGNNAVGTKIVETLLKHANRLFGVATSNGDSPPMGLIERTREQLMLDIDDPSKLNRNNSARSFQSPRSRPKEKAPPPPVAARNFGNPILCQPLPKTKGTEDNPLIDLNDEWTAVNRAEAAKYYGLQGTQNHYHDDERGTSGLGQADSFDSLDSFDDFPEESLSRSNTERRPDRPPPPAMRQAAEMANPRPMSYNLAIHHENPQPMPRTQAIVIENPLAKAPSIKKPTVLPDSVVGISDDNNRTVVAVEAPTPRIKPPLPVKPKPEDNKESSRL